ncbi:hypothetical protein [Modestobacter roseus]|uniref:Uncharacterized protein n=1 Tax=Modestobacter roseus TaxID=1181884 RepID=A0A562ISM7_9ACTN|nr:hypothetical protein [Modestobacter roseus]MQA32623.1 hypothetical protein [Modestobacter roseus]TWH73733.1 hypothetical protein JD78_02257 [Modestobacter roseus]
MTQPHPDSDPADPTRSGEDVVDAVRTAEAGSAIEDAHGLPGAPGSAPVEQVRDDPEMTGGQVVLGEDESRPAGNPDPAAAGSGGAQSIVGARASDRVAADEPLPDGPAY